MAAVSKVNRNYAVVTGVAALIALFSLWLPWIFVPVEVRLERENLPKPEYPEMRDLLSLFSEVQTGWRGIIDVGMLVPSWIFILLIAVAAMVSFLNIVKLFETSYFVVISILVFSAAFLIFWVGSATAEGCKMQAGFPFAAAAMAMILVAAIKNHQRGNSD